MLANLGAVLLLKADRLDSRSNQFSKSFLNMSFPFLLLAVLHYKIFRQGKDGKIRKQSFQANVLKACLMISLIILHTKTDSSF